MPDTSRYGPEPFGPSFPAVTDPTFDDDPTNPVWLQQATAHRDAQRAQATARREAREDRAAAHEDPEDHALHCPVIPPAVDQWTPAATSSAIEHVRREDRRARTRAAVAHLFERAARLIDPNRQEEQ